MAKLATSRNRRKHNPRSPPPGGDGPITGPTDFCTRRLEIVDDEACLQCFLRHEQLRVAHRLRSHCVNAHLVVQVNPAKRPSPSAPRPPGQIAASADHPAPQPQDSHGPLLNSPPMPSQQLRSYPMDTPPPHRSLPRNGKFS